MPQNEPPGTSVEGPGRRQESSHDPPPSGPEPRRRLIRILLPLLCVGGLGVAHLEVLTRGPGYAGPLLVLDHLFDVGLVVALVTLSGAAGRRLLRSADLEPVSSLERFLYGVVVGAGIWSLLFLGMGAVGLLSPLGVWAVLGVGGLLLHRDLAALGPLIRECVGRLRQAVPGGWPALAVGAATAGAALFLLLHGSAPPGDWDSLMYHLEVPDRWLEEGRIFLLEGNLHVAYTGLIQLLYLPFLAVGSPAAAALLNGVFALLLGVAVLVLGARLLDAETGTLAAAVLWASTGLLMVAVTARVDTTLALYLFLGHGALVAAVVEPRGARRSLLLAALVLGLSTGIKYHALAYGACVVPLGLWAVWNGAEDAGGRARLLALVSGIVGVAALPWIVKNQALLGAPFYPFFSERVLQPWLAELYGTTSAPVVLPTGAAGPLGQVRESFDLLALFLSPERLTVEPEAAHYNLNFLLVLLPLGLFFLRRPAVTALLLPPLVYVGLVVFLRPTTNVRYLLPGLAPLTLVASHLAVASSKKVAGPGVRRAILAVVAAACLVPTVRSAVAWTLRGPVVGHALGQTSRQDYLAAGYGYYATLAGTVNRIVPPAGEVLLLWEARGFYLAPGHLPDNVLSNWPLLVPYLDRTGSCLRETDITHVLAGEGAVGYYVQRGADRDGFALDRFRRFADRCLGVEARGPGFTLYRVEGAGAAE